MRGSVALYRRVASRSAAKSGLPLDHRNRWSTVTVYRPVARCAARSVKFGHGPGKIEGRSSSPDRPWTSVLAVRLLPNRLHVNSVSAIFQATTVALITDFSKLRYKSLPGATTLPKRPM